MFSPRMNRGVVLYFVREVDIILDNHLRLLVKEAVLYLMFDGAFPSASSVC